MTMHLGAFAELLTATAALQRIAAVQDDTVFTQGDDMRVPAQLPFLVAEAALLEELTVARAQIQSPSLRQVANIDILPLGLGLVFVTPEEISIHSQSPTPMRGDEAVNFLVAGTGGGGQIHYGLVWYSDGPVQPVSGSIYSVRFTAVSAGTPLAWENIPIVFEQDLPVGNYDIVGMQIFGVGLVATRLNFVGGAWRPGVPGGVTMVDNIGHHFRHGKMGVMGNFHTNTQPTLDVISATAAITNVGVLDLIFKG